MEGTFILEDLPNKKLIFEISFLGYKTYTKEIDFTQKNVYDEFFFLHQKSMMIDVVQIKGYRCKNIRCCCCCTGSIVSDSNIGDGKHSLFEKTPLSSFENKITDVTVYPKPTIDYLIIKNEDEYDRVVILDIQG